MIRPVKPLWPLTISARTLCKEGKTNLPLYLQIADLIAEAIRDGRLLPRGNLPSSRTLAEDCGVHRNTILAAYDELRAQGYIQTQAGKGTFVSNAIPKSKKKNSKSSLGRRALGFELSKKSIPARAPASDRLLHMGGGNPDPRLLPTKVYARAYRRALLSGGHKLIDYAAPSGHQGLREALSTMMRQNRGVIAAPNEILVSRGSQMALYLIAQTLLSPQDTVAVEALGYRPAWDALSLSGAKLCPIRVDEDGLSIQHLKHFLKKQKIRALYLTPHHQYPTMARLSAGRRMELLSLAREQRFAIIEDDFDHEFHYRGHPVLPLASQDRDGVVIYVGTLSKVFAPGLRMGYIVAPSEVIERLVRYRSCVDYHGDHVAEAAITELIEDGELQRHIHRSRRIYHARRDILAQILSKMKGLSFSLPPGGMAIWSRVDNAIDVDSWATRAAAKGLFFSPASRFTFSGGSENFARFGFAAMNEAELLKAGKILSQTQ